MACVGDQNDRDMYRNIYCISIQDRGSTTRMSRKTLSAAHIVTYPARVKACANETGHDHPGKRYVAVIILGSRRVDHEYEGYSTTPSDTSAYLCMQWSRLAVTNYAGAMTHL